MDKYHIAILTSTGVCYINQLSIDAGLRDSNKSIATISGGGKSKIKYHDFVDIDVGVINRRTHHNNYRLVLSQDINHGNSWQLGVYIAHLLYYHEHNLSANAPNLIFATGEIKLRDNAIDFDVVAIDLIDEKISHIIDIINDADKYSNKILFVPKDNMDDAVKACQNHAIIDKIEIIAIACEQDIIDYFNCSFDYRQQSKQPNNILKYVFFLIILFTFSMASIAAPFLWQYNKKRDVAPINIEQSKPKNIPTPQPLKENNDINPAPSTEKLQPLQIIPKKPTTPEKNQPSKKQQKKRFEW